MWKKLLTRLTANPSLRETLSEILSLPDNRETILGVKRAPPPTPEQITRDVGRVIRYSTTEDYSTWSKEAWSEALECMDKLMDKNLTDRQVDFYRGALAQTLQLLRISYRARNIRDTSREERANV